MKNKYLNFLILLVIDIFILSVLIISINAEPSGAIIEIFIIPVILVVNIVIAITLWFFKNKLYKLFGLNAVVASVMFNLLFSGWFYYERKINYDIMEFKIYNTNYELELNKKNNSYSIQQMLKSNSTLEITSGKFKIKDDKIYLIDRIDSVKEMTVYKDSLSGFGGDNPKISLYR